MSLLNVLWTTRTSFAKALFDYRDFVVPLTVIPFYIFCLTLQWSAGVVLFGILLVFYIPGSLIVRTFYPKEKSIEIIERTALSIWISLSAAGLTGILLNYLPWGITFETVLLSNVIISIIFLTSAYLRFSKRVESY